MRNTFCDTIIAELANRDDIFIISGDAGLGVFDDFSKQRPDRFLNLGVAEQNMLSHAAGMAMAGFKVFVYNIVPFVIYRSFEQVRNDICYQELPVTMIGIGSGLTYAPQGMTHYSIEDLTVAMTMPNLRVFSPADPAEARAAAHACLNADTPCYVRLAKRGEPVLHSTPPTDVSKPLLLAEGKEVAIVVHGPIAADVLAAAEQLRAQGLTPRVVSVPQIAPLDMEAINAAVAGCRNVLVIEEHFINGGLGTRIAQWRALNDAPWKLHLMALPNEFVHVIRNQNGMREHYALDVPSMVARVKAIAV
ncbi:MAG TPA: transketolase C-terminal domain-containing protein [Rhodocyclaceae bacterium]|nr:transketolase C-terminal domain-containing protein [Rhodocyclaceae bacterium]